MRNRLMVSLVFLVSVSGRMTFRSVSRCGWLRNRQVSPLVISFSSSRCSPSRLGCAVSLSQYSRGLRTPTCFHSPPAAVGQKIKFVFRFINARNLVHQVADLPVYGSTTSVRLCAVGGATAVLGRYRHFGCCNVRLAILRIPQTSPRRASTSCIARDTLFFSSNLSSFMRFPLVRDCLPLLRGPSASVRAKDPICEALQRNRERVARL
jgi:hypothetical protein